MLSRLGCWDSLLIKLRLPSGFTATPDAIAILLDRTISVDRDHQRDYVVPLSGPGGIPVFRVVRCQLQGLCLDTGVNADCIASSNLFQPADVAE